MNPIRLRRVFLALMIMSGTSAAQAKPPYAWRLNGASVSVFAEHDHTWRIQLVGGLPERSALAWRITINERTLASGESNWEANLADGAVGTVSWRSPPVKDGVAIEAICKLTAVAERRPLAETEIAVWIFSGDPFESRREWMKSLNLVCFTSNDATKRTIRDTKLPLRVLSQGAMIESLTNEILVVSSSAGDDWSETQSRRVRDYVSRGGRCLWLSPAPEAVVLESERVGAPGATPWERIDLRRHAIIRDIDKRLDARTWTDESIRIATFRQSARRNGTGEPRAVWESGSDRDEWPWIDAVNGRGGRLIVCGFPLLDDWSRGPTPRYLLASILRSLESADSTGTMETNAPDAASSGPNAR